MSALARMVAHASAEGAPHASSCAAVVAAAMPGSRWAAVYDRICALPAGVRRRVFLQPELAARWAARHLRCQRLQVDGAGEAWGLVKAGPLPSFAFRTACGTWWARTRGGVGKVHVSRVRAAWSVV
jgi:hypothetical protein